MKNIKNRSKSSGSGSSSGIDEEIRSLTFSYIPHSALQKVVYKNYIYE